LEEALPAAEEHAAIVEEPVVEEEPLEEIAAAESEVPFTAYALFEFPGESDEDLPFQPGDIIEVLAIVDSQWWRGSLNGREGIFPAEFVSRDAPAPVAEVETTVTLEEEPVVAAGSSVGYVIAQYDLEAQNDGDLAFKTDARIEVLEVIDDDWIRGLLDGAEGLVPRNYVSEIHTS